MFIFVVSFVGEPKRKPPPFFSNQKHHTPHGLGTTELEHRMASRTDMLVPMEDAPPTRACPRACSRACPECRRRCGRCLHRAWARRTSCLPRLSFLRRVIQCSLSLSPPPAPACGAGRSMPRVKQSGCPVHRVLLAWGRGPGGACRRRPFSRRKRGDPVPPGPAPHRRRPAAPRRPLCAVRSRLASSLPAHQPPLPPARRQTSPSPPSLFVFFSFLFLVGVPLVRPSLSPPLRERSISS